MDFKYLTGLRKGDILRLKRNQIKDDGIHVTIHKTNKPIIIGWTRLLREAVTNIRKLKQPINGLYLFNTRKGQPYTNSGFSSIWQRKMRAALVDGVIKERFRDHDIRAKTASDAELDHAFKLLGHGDIKVTQQHYDRKARTVMPLG